MSFNPRATIHPSAVISAESELADGVVIGPFAVLEGPVQVGADTVVGPHVHLVGNVNIGRGNRFHSGCVIGDFPQHMSYKGEPTKTIIGDNNIFREGVTVHRGMPVGEHCTRIGSNNLFMVNSHIAHDCVLGNHIVMANGSVIGGHCVIQDRAFLSGNTAVHQNCRVGTLAMIGGTTCISQDLCPFWICQGRINELHSVNVVGMRRAGYSRDEINAVRTAYRLLNRSGRTIPTAIEEMTVLFPNSPAIRVLVDFIQSSKRGICTGHQNDRMNSGNNIPPADHSDA
jgi:UDP-N-acetylglucosamine acyltransferase